MLQLHRSLSFTGNSSRKTSITSYLYSSIYKNRRQGASIHFHQQASFSYNQYQQQQQLQKIHLTRSNIDSDNRDLVTIGNNEDIFIPKFQVVNEEENENIIQTSTD